MASIHSVSVAEFDVDRGNTLVSSYPDFELPNYGKEWLGNCCLPDGGHLHRQDRTFLILHVKSDTLDASKKGKKAPKKSAKASSDPHDTTTMATQRSQSEQLLYGVSFFMNQPDSTVKRGAVQRSLLILSRQPFFERYSAPAIATLSKVVCSKSPKTTKQLLKNLYTAIADVERTQGLQMALLNNTYVLSICSLGVDRFEGASLVELINRFQAQTIVLWYALLLRQRLLFVGQHAQEVGSCCLAAPLLVAPLTGFSKAMSPYVFLNDLEPIERPAFICGSTNMLYEQKTDWWDVLGSFSSATVVCKSIKVTSSDKAFMKNVLSGVRDQKGEQWARHQFEQHTLRFLFLVKSNTLPKEYRKLFSSFAETEMYSRYLLHADKGEPTTEEAQKPIQLFHQLRDSIFNPDTEITKLQQPKLLYDLSNSLQDISAIEEICDEDGVALISTILSEQNSQTRKYAVSVLAQLALSIKGQVAMMAEGVLPKVLTMLDDRMQNVVTAACYCIVKISSLYIGVQILESHGVLDKLSQIVLTPEAGLQLKIHCTKALLQMGKYSMRESAPSPLVLFYLKEIHSSDEEYRTLIVLLLDMWAIDLPSGLPVRDSVREQVAAMAARLNDGELDIERRLGAVTNALSDFSNAIGDGNYSTEITQYVDAGVVEVLTENISLRLVNNHRLPRFAYWLLSIIADSNHGRKFILKSGAIEIALEAMKTTKRPLVVFNAARLVEVCCQHRTTAEAMMSYRVIDILLAYLTRYGSMPDLVLLCVPAYAGLRHLSIRFTEEVHKHLVGDKMVLDMLCSIRRMVPDMPQAHTSLLELLNISAPPS